jgi:hypothetical protein
MDNVVSISVGIIPQHMRTNLDYPKDADQYEACGLLHMIHLSFLIEYAYTHMLSAHIKKDCAFLQALEPDNFAYLPNHVIDVFDSVDFAYMPMLSILFATYVCDSLTAKQVMDLYAKAIDLDHEYRTVGFVGIGGKVRSLAQPEYSMLTRFIYYTAFGKFEPDLFAETDRVVYSDTPLTEAKLSDARFQVLYYYKHQQQKFLCRSGSENTLEISE